MITDIEFMKSILISIILVHRDNSPQCSVTSSDFEQLPFSGYSESSRLICFVYSTS